MMSMNRKKLDRRRQLRKKICQSLLSVAFLAVWWFPFMTSAHRLPWLASKVSLPPRGSNKTPLQNPSWSIARGGGTFEKTDDGEDDDDEERYSRQVYTMGARAHGLIRSSTIYVDGPMRSGLLWESVKNLVLSGVGKLVLISDEDDSPYHVPGLDDLGNSYIRGACNELKTDRSDDDSLDFEGSVSLLKEYIRRLNPALQVSSISKDDLQNESHHSGVLLCIDRAYKQQEEWNDFCRRKPSSSQWKFVSVETAGVYGRVFCDFGTKHEIHDSDGETPLVVPLDKVTAKSCDVPRLLVKSVEGERHDVSRDDVVVFQRSNGSTMEDIPCRVINVLTPESIEVVLVDPQTGILSPEMDERLEERINTEAVTFSRQKQIEKVSFRSLRDCVQEAEEMFEGKTVSEIFTPCDLDKSFDDIRRKVIFGCFQAMDSFVKEHGRLPLASDASSLYQQAGLVEGLEHCENFASTCSAKFVPLQAVFGAIASQECLKAISGLYNPVRQFLLYDCDEVLTEGSKTIAQGCETGMAFILGSEVSKRLQNLNVFVVGSGAIGCEILKNIAAMDIGTGEDCGNIVVTDMDTIEKSNLSRQLLFRDSDIGKFKSKAAAEAVCRMNPRLKLEHHTSKVGDEEDPGPFDSRFWSKKVDVILNALDNMEARLFMDEQCVANQKALVDAGTLGSKGNVQVVVPHQSESYGSSVDPPEPAIPVCTLKNFPYAIAHTIQWGRDLFDGLFVRRPRQANQYAQEYMNAGVEGLAQKLDDDMSDEAALEAAKELAEDLMIQKDGDIDQKTELMMKISIEWAIQLGKELFHDAIVDLLEEHPIDEVDEEGELFWSGSRKPPKALSFSLSEEKASEDSGTSQKEEIDNNTIDFVRSAARLRFETLTGIISDSRKNFGIVSVDTAKEALKSVLEKSNSNDTQTEKEKSKQEAIRERLSTLNISQDQIKSGSVRALFPAEFEKDDESNDHIAFITAASNLRAICYGIAPVDAMETRKVAGNIIPAMITTTAFVSALSCLELVKLTQGLPLHRHRNAFINLALPFFAFTAPLPAEEYPGVRGGTHTLWDKIVIKEGKKTLTLKRLLRRIQKKVYADDPDAVQVSNISIGPIMIYANFLHEDDEELLNTNIWEVVENAIQAGEEFDEQFSRDKPSVDGETKKSSLISTASCIDITVSVEDAETFDEVELPQIRLQRSK